MPAGRLDREAVNVAFDVDVPVDVKRIDIPGRCAEKPRPLTRSVARADYEPQRVIGGLQWSRYPVCELL